MSTKRKKPTCTPESPSKKSKETNVHKCSENEEVGATALKVSGHDIVVNISDDALIVTTRHEHVFERAGKTIHIRAVPDSNGSSHSNNVILFGGVTVTVNGVRIETNRSANTATAVEKTKRYTLHDADRIQTVHESNGVCIVWTRTLGATDGIRVRLSNSAAMEFTTAQMNKIARLDLELSNSAFFDGRGVLECDELVVDASNSACARGIRANRELEVDVSNSARVDVASASDLTSKYIWVMNDARCVVNGKVHKI